MALDLNTILFYLGTFFTLFVGIFYLITFFENREKIADPKAKRFPKISIIVPAFNEAKTIKETIESLLRLDYPSNQLEVVIIDDGSTDNTFKIAQEFTQIFSFTKQNGGKGSAINLGLEKVSGEFVVIMDADSFVNKNTLKNMIGYFEDDQIMAVTPTLKVYKPKGFWQKMQYIEYLLSILFKKIFSYIGGIYVTPGPFSVYRKSFFDKYGGFAKNNLTEDMEIALRIQSKGYDIENSINAVVFTVAPNNFKSFLRQRVRWYTGMIENVYTYKHLFGAHTGNLGVFVMPVMVISIVMALGYLCYYGVSIIGNIANNIQQVYLIDFDLGNIINRYIANFSILNFINPFFVLLFILLLFTLAMFVLAKVYSKDKTRLIGSVVVYLLTYGPISGAMWFTTVMCKVLQLKVRW